MVILRTNKYNKRAICFILLCLVANTVLFGQKTKPKLALLLAIKGEAYVNSKSGENRLNIPYFFENNDVITVKTGSVELLQANGEEIKLEAGKTHKITLGKDTESLKIDEFYINLSKERYFTQSQSNSALTVRGQSVNVVLFPISSKLANIDNAFITVDFKTTEEVIVELEVFNMLNNELVYSNKNISKTEIALNEIPLQQGHDYIWMIKADEKETDQIGLITYLDKTKQETLQQFELNNKIDFLKAYQYYTNNELWFAAKHTIKLGTEKYPETDLFGYLMKVMLK
ncbi:MAG: hypothetical protein GQ564_22855 [Bacteroidales bacterium]|nr:hypothetical protein [Bacteroidales bacterium]